MMPLRVGHYQRGYQSPVVLTKSKQLHLIQLDELKRGARP
jgi:hypothetical protein